MIENNVLCGQCVADGVRSTVQVQTTFITAMAYNPYHDADGALHQHDPNWHTTSYLCSHGHAVQRSIRTSCWCGWPQSETST